MLAAGTRRVDVLVSNWLEPSRVPEEGILVMPRVIAELDR
jgi:hypothetical protein